MDRIRYQEEPETHMVSAGDSDRVKPVQLPQRPRYWQYTIACIQLETQRRALHLALQTAQSMDQLLGLTEGAIENHQEYCDELKIQLDGAALAYYRLRKTKPRRPGLYDKLRITLYRWATRQRTIDLIGEELPLTRAEELLSLGGDAWTNLTQQKAN